MKNIMEYGMISAIGTAGLTVIDFLFGGGEFVYSVLILLVISTILDWISGRRVAKKDGINASEYGIDGAWRTGQIYLLLAFAHFVDKTFLLDKVSIYGFEPNGAIFYVFASAILVDTLKSVTANHARLGWDKWMKPWMLEWVANEIENKIARSKERKQKILNGREV
jgi:phage-related holin